MEQFYYCTKKIFFKTIDVLNSIVDIFEEYDALELDIDVIYNSLRDKLNVNSVNRNNLKTLLCYNGDNIKKSDVESYVANFNDITDYSSIFVPEHIQYPPITSETDLNYEVSKLRIIPKRVVFEWLLSFYDKSGNTELQISELYEMLKELLGGKTANKNSLQHLLSSLNTTTINYNSLQKLYESFLSQVNVYRQNEISKLVACALEKVNYIHVDNRNIEIKFLASPSVYRQFSSYGIERVSQLQNMTQNDIYPIVENHGKAYIQLLNKLADSFAVSVSNMFCDIVIKQLDRHGNAANTWNRNIDILYRRISGETLAASCKKYGLTREAARQIEIKYLKKFRQFSGEFSGSVIRMLRLYAQNNSYISVMEIKTIINQYSDAFIYLLKICESADINYIPELDIFEFIDELDWYEEIITCAREIPDTIESEKFETYLHDIHNRIRDFGIHIPTYYIDKIAKSGFQKQGKFYTRTKLMLQDKYQRIIEKYYPNGIAIYNEDDLSHFREYYAVMFGDNLSPNNRAIQNAIQRVSILRNRGIYISTNNAISVDEMLSEICEYIDNETKTLFMTNSIFYLFHDKLIAEGIDNRYYLQGLLRKYVGDKYYFTRDYISKSKEETSIYSSIVNYIKSVNGIVTKEDLHTEFPGVPQNVFCFALSNDEIIVGNACCVNKEFVTKNQGHVEALLYLINEMTKDGKIHGTYELMKKLRNNFSTILKDYKINDCYFLYSIIESLFSDKFSMNRPFFAAQGTVVGNQTERLCNFVRERETVTIDEFMNYIHRNHFVAATILKVLDDVSEEVFFKDKNTLIINTAIDIPYNIDACIDEFLDNYVENNSDVEKSYDFSDLPELNIEWNEWLLYSMVKEYSQKYDAITTDSSFAKASPMFVKKDM